MSMTKRIRVAITASLTMILLSHDLRAAPVLGSSLNIGPTDSTANTVNAGSGAAIGFGNDVPGASLSLFVGYANYALTSCDSSAAFGTENYVAGFANFSFGYHNSNLGIVGGMNFLMGVFNAIVDGANYSESSALFGENNYGEGVIGCFVAGQLNDVRYANDSIALGTGLIIPAGADSRTVVGKFNFENEATALFVVGNGTSSNRSNALVVYANGDARVSGVLRTTAPAGDIPMFVP